MNDQQNQQPVANSQLLYVTLILDESGSMQSCKGAALAGFNVAVTLDGVCIIKINSLPAGAYAVTCIAALFGSATCNVPGHKITKCRVSSFKIIIPFFFRNLPRIAVIALFLWNPNATIVAE